MGGINAAPSAQTQALQTAAASPEEIAAQSPALPAIATECPPIKVRPGAEALYFYGKGQVGNPRDLQYQAVIDKQSRNCVVSNGLITVKMGVVGRFMLGPSGNQTSVELPLRFAVERDEAPLFSEKYEIPVHARRRRPGERLRQGRRECPDPLRGWRQHHHLGRLRQRQGLISPRRRLTPARRRPSG